MKATGSFKYIQARVYEYIDASLYDDAGISKWEKHGRAVRIDGYHHELSAYHDIGYRNIKYQYDHGDDEYVYFRNKKGYTKDIRITRDDYNRLFDTCGRCKSGGVVESFIPQAVSKWERNPDLQVSVYLSEGGVQVDILQNGSTVDNTSYDFTSGYYVSELQSDLLSHIKHAIDEFRKGK